MLSSCIRARRRKVTYFYQLHQISQPRVYLTIFSIVWLHQYMANALRNKKARQICRARFGQRSCSRLARSVGSSANHAKQIGRTSPALGIPTPIQPFPNPDMDGINRHATTLQPSSGSNTRTTRFRLNHPISLIRQLQPILNNNSTSTQPNETVGAADSPASNVCQNFTAPIGAVFGII